MGYFRRGALVERTTSTATSSTAYSLTNSSTTFQRFTGSVAQTVNLPSALTMSSDVGTKFTLINASTGLVSVYDGGGTLLGYVLSGTERTFQLQSALTVAGVWSMTTGPEGYDSPVRMFASSPADSRINFQTVQVQTVDGTGLSVPPISSVIPSLPVTTIDFSALTVTGGPVSITWPTITAGNYIRVGFTLLASGSIQALFSAQATSLAGLANAGALFVKNGLAIGWIDLQGVTATTFKTAGSVGTFTTLIDNSGTSSIDALTGTLDTRVGEQMKNSVVSGQSWSQITMSLQKGAITTGNVFVEIYSSDSSGAPTGAALATSGSLPISGLGSGALADAVFPISYVVGTVGNGVVVVLRRDAAAIAAGSQVTYKTITGAGSYSGQGEGYNGSTWGATNGVQPRVKVESGGAAIIENAVGGVPRIVRFSAGGSGGSSGSGTGSGSDLGSLLYRAQFIDKFTESYTDANSSINSAGTNSTYNTANPSYTLSYDASKTVTTSGTSFTLSAAPGYSMVLGDVLVNQATGEVKAITSVTSQTQGVLESAFATNLAAAAITVSQCVRTKDIYNLAVDGASLASSFGSATFSDIMVDYADATTGTIFTPNTTPVIGFTASPTGTAWTLKGVRATNETDTAPNTLLPSAGTSLYLRFFSNKTSGSGTVNLINYTAFMQKTTASASGGTLNSAYAFTNSVGTPVNATLAVTGGKSTVALSFNYAVGVNSGLPYGSLDVYLNGQMIPRFINSTLTPDASYTEMSASVIQLDRDYSSQNLSVEVLQRVQVVDVSTANTTQLSGHNEILQNGFQSFIATNKTLVPTTGTPAVGTFYSSISNRAPIVDITQDLKASFGVERIVTQSLYALQTEFGPNGETVWATPNDDRGLIRAVGSWAAVADIRGARLIPGSNTTDYIEITFYGTSLNMLIGYEGTAIDSRASIDGGAEGTNIFLTANSSVLTARGYAPNQIVPLVSGALGVHTVKIRNNNASVLYGLYGFEVINTASTANINVNPGVGYVNGLKLVGPAAQTPAYNAPVTGTKGGRVVTYLGSNGVVGQAWQAVNATAASLSSTVVINGAALSGGVADHTNEEPARTYYFREFGAGRTQLDDFSTLASAAQANVAFTLDDGTTTLIGSGVITPGGTPDRFYINTANGFWTLTFVGTGLDVVIGGGSTWGVTASLAIDGATVSTSVNAIFPPSTPNNGTVKLVSGLPYGTHTVKFAHTGGSVTNIPSFERFIVYQPKKPSIPAGALELADYNVMANFIANSTASATNISQGVLRKATSVREMIYGQGTWQTALDIASCTGWIAQTNSTAVGDTFQYTFFGTGFDYRFLTPSASIVTATLTVDGNANTSAYTTSFYGITSYNTTTGLVTIPATSLEGAGVIVSGLPLGVHTFKLVWASGAGGAIKSDAFDIITPIHSAKSNLYADLQNTLAVGSQAISDNRLTTPIKNALPATKAWSQALGVNNSASTSTNALVPMPDMSTSIRTSGGALFISWNGSFYSATTNVQVMTQIYVDGLAVFAGSPKHSNISAAANSNVMVSDSVIVPVSAGFHKVDIYWANGGAGTVNVGGVERQLIVQER